MAKQFETDVVVVAAGLSGLAAAISAAPSPAMSWAIRLRTCASSRVIRFSAGW